MDYEKYDSVLFSLSHGGVPQMVDIIFSFLSRKTDFYTGAGIEEAQSMVLKYFHKHREEACKLADTTKKRREEEQRKLDERQAAQKANEEAESAAKDDGCTVMDTTDEEAAEFEKNKTEVTSATGNEERSSTSDAGVTSEVKESKKQSDKMMPNSGKILDEFEKEFHQNISMLRTQFCQDGSMLQKVENEGDEAVKDLADSQRTISVISQKFVTALELLRESRTIGDERMQSCVKLRQQNDELVKMWKECLREFIHWKGKYEDLKTALKKKDPAICAQKERIVEDSSAAKETMSVNGLHVTEPEDAFLTFYAILTAIRTISDFSDIFFLLTFICERFYATLLLRSYEHSTSYFWLILLVSNLIVSFLCSMVYFSQYISTSVLFIPTMINVLVLAVMHQYVKYVNTKMKSRQKNEAGQFSLTVRFQIEENFKVIKAGRYVVFLVLFEIVICSVVFALTFKDDPVTSTSSIIIFDMLITVLVFVTTSWGICLWILRHQIPPDSFTTLMLLTLIFSFDKYKDYTYSLFGINVVHNLVMVDRTSTVESQTYMNKINTTWNDAFAKRNIDPHIKRKFLSV